MNFCSKIASQTLLNAIKRDSNQNIIVSPLSFNAILNMIVNGLSQPTTQKRMLENLGSTKEFCNPTTQERILEFLGSRNIKDLNSQFAKSMAIATSKKNQTNLKEGPLLSFVNGVWVSERYKLNHSYENIVKTVYKAEARYLDFSKAVEAVKEVNAWAKSASEGLITNVLRLYDITEDTRLILGNALYFKGSWVKPFDCELTKDKNFYLLNGDKIKAPFMTGCPRYTYGSFTDFQVVQIPYEMGDDTKRQVSMYIFLPNKKNGLQSLLEKVNSDSEFLAKHTELEMRKITKIWIPKFKFTYFNEKVLETMKKSGLSNLDVSDMLHPPIELEVSKIIQKAFIEIDENGTEAAAVSLVHIGYGCAWERPEPITFVADHPFMFTIMEENSGLVFFTGAVLNPLQET